jgi:hypothetical protein
MPGLGDSEPKMVQRLSDARAELSGDHWVFGARFASKTGETAPWAFRVHLSLDQEAGAVRAQVVKIDQLQATEGEVSGPADDGSFTVSVPQGTESLSFEGSSVALSELPPGGAQRIRLRLDVRGTETGAGA